MPPELRPPLPRSAADPVRLQSLRQRALARMAQDETSDRSLTRRSSLQRFALIAAVFTPAGRRLLRGQQALAAMPRTNVPQYGAPPQYHPPPAPVYPDVSTGAPMPVHALPATRAMLKSVQNWAGTSVELVGPTGWGEGVLEVPAWSILYSYSISSSKPFPLNAVADPNTKTTYVVRGNHDFYISDKSDILAGSIGKGTLTFRGSLFHAPGAGDRIADTITAFAAAIDDKQIRKEENRFDSIDLTPGIPFEFWNTNESTLLPTISMVSGDSKRLWLYLLSPNGKYTAQITVAIPNKKVVRTTVNDKLVYGAN